AKPTARQPTEPGKPPAGICCIDPPEIPGGRVDTPLATNTPGQSTSPPHQQSSEGNAEPSRTRPTRPTRRRTRNTSTNTHQRKTRPTESNLWAPAFNEGIQLCTRQPRIYVKSRTVESLANLQPSVTATSKKQNANSDNSVSKSYCAFTPSPEVKNAPPKKSHAKQWAKPYPKTS